MRILLCNIGYLLGDRGSLGGYLPSPREALVGDRSVEGRTVQRLVDLLTRERPDVVCLVEVDRGSFRTATDGQLSDLVGRLARHDLSYASTVFNKYGEDRLIGRLPFFRKLGNAVLLSDDRPVAARYLKTGMKRLVIEASLPGDVTLFLAHLSVRAASRRRQLAELAEMVANRRSDVIVAGDLNTFHGPTELEDFLATTGLEAHVPGDTLQDRPFDELFAPSRAVDMFLTSPGIDVAEATVLPPAISDHRAVRVDAQVT